MFISRFMPFQHKICIPTAHFHVTHKPNLQYHILKFYFCTKYPDLILRVIEALRLGYKTFDWRHDDIWNTAGPVGAWNSYHFSQNTLLTQNILKHTDIIIHKYMHGIYHG